MNRHEEIKNAYKSLGGDATFYDGMITCSTLSGKAVCKLVWNMDKRKNDHYLELALSGIPKNFTGKMLEVPVGTGVLSMPVYETMPDADITCLDYSPDMMERAKRQAEKRGLKNVQFMQGDVGKLPFEDESFDLVMSLNGFHAFPDKEAAYSEIFRVLRPGGIFCGCFYVKGENKRTDFLVDVIYTPKGYFTPPYETADGLRKRLKAMYWKAEVKTVESMAAFRCRKGKAGPYCDCGYIKKLNGNDNKGFWDRWAKRYDRTISIEKGNVKMLDATALSYASGTFDAVVISNALHIMPATEKALAEIRRVLKPDGILIAPTFTAAGSVFGRLKIRMMEFSGFRVFHKWKPQEYLDFLRACTGSCVRAEDLF